MPHGNAGGNFPAGAALLTVGVGVRDLWAVALQNGGVAIPERQGSPAPLRGLPGKGGRMPTEAAAAGIAAGICTEAAAEEGAAEEAAPTAQEPPAAQSKPGWGDSDLCDEADRRGGSASELATCAALASAEAPRNVPGDCTRMGRGRGHWPPGTDKDCRTQSGDHGRPAGDAVEA